MEKEVLEYVKDKLDFIKDQLATLQNNLECLRDRMDDITSTPVNELDKYIYGYNRNGNYVNGLYDDANEEIAYINDIVKQVEKVEELINDDEI